MNLTVAELNKVLAPFVGQPNTAEVRAKISEAVSAALDHTNPLMDIAEVCRRLGISRSSLERLRNNKDLSPPFPDPAFVLGRRPRWTNRVFNEWLRAHVAQAGAPRGNN